jgi:hypothetical protein
MLTPLIDGIMTIAVAIALTAGSATAAYEWEPEVREPAVQVETASVQPHPECVTVTIGWDEDGDPYKIAGGTPNIRTSVVGTFLWVMLGDPVIETGYVEDYVHSIPIEEGVDEVQVCP